jgi:O-antigen ligase
MIIYRGLGSFLSYQSINNLVSYYSQDKIPDNQIWIPNIFKKMGIRSNYLTFGQDRLSLWHTGFNQFISNPIGFGPASYSWHPLKIIDNRRQGPHNTFLEVGLTGGYLGLSAWLVFLTHIGKKNYQILKNKKNEIAYILLFLFIALTINSFFINMFTLRWLWILFAFIIAYSQQAKIDKK